MNDTNTLQAINGFKIEVAEMFKSLNKSIDARINNVVDKTISNKLDFHTETKRKALEDITVNSPLNPEQLTKIVRDLLNDVASIKNNTTNYALYDQMQVVNNQFSQIQTDFNYIKNTLNQMIADKYIESDIEPSELESLYQKTGLGPDYVASHFHISKEMLYKILNGKEANPNEKRKHNLKQFFLKKIYDANL